MGASLGCRRCCDDASAATRIQVSKQPDTPLSYKRIASYPAPPAAKSQISFSIADPVSLQVRNASQPIPTSSNAAKPRCEIPVPLRTVAKHSNSAIAVTTKSLEPSPQINVTKVPLAIKRHKLSDAGGDTRPHVTIAEKAAFDANVPPLNFHNANVPHSDTKNIVHDDKKRDPSPVGRRPPSAAGRPSSPVHKGSHRSSVSSFSTLSQSSIVGRQVEERKVQDTAEGPGSSLGRKSSQLVPIPQRQRANSIVGLDETSAGTSKVPGDLGSVAVENRVMANMSENAPTKPIITISLNKAELGAGCYLQYSNVGGGVMTLLWSRTYPSGGTILAFARPEKEVPAFKYRGESRKQDLVKAVQSDKALYYAAWVSFMKHAKQNSASVTFLEGINEVLPVAITFLDPKSRLVWIEPNQWYPLHDAVAVCALHPASESLRGLSTLPPGMFVQIGAKAGAAIIL